MKREARQYVVLLVGIVALIAVWTPQVLAYMKFNGNDTYKTGGFDASRKWFFGAGVFWRPPGPNDSRDHVCNRARWSTGRNSGLLLVRARDVGRTNRSTAQLFLGTLYGTGLGAKGDPEKAIVWLSKTAAHGDKTAAQMLLAYRLRSGST